MLRSQRFSRTIISYESPCFSIVFPNFHCLKIVCTAFIAVRNGICDQGFNFLIEHLSVFVIEVKKMVSSGYTGIYGTSENRLVALLDSATTQ